MLNSRYVCRKVELFPGEADNMVIELAVQSISGHFYVFISLEILSIVVKRVPVKAGRSGLCLTTWSIMRGK